jgi:hypothetical protein
MKKKSLKEKNKKLKIEKRLKNESKKKAPYETQK